MVVDNQLLMYNYGRQDTVYQQSRRRDTMLQFLQYIKMSNPIPCALYAAQDIFVQRFNA